MQHSVGDVYWTRVRFVGSFCVFGDGRFGGGDEESEADCFSFSLVGRAGVDDVDAWMGLAGWDR